MTKSKKAPEKQIKYWLAHAQEDLLSAKVMLDAGRYTWCAFICQQALEKLLKAGYVKKEKCIPPRIHKLERLLELLTLKPPEDLLEALILIDKYYIVARYPSYKTSVDIKTRKVAGKIYQKTREIYLWLQKEMALK
jgi:HEPN domain-containing protein